MMPIGARACPSNMPIERDRPAGIGQLPPHDHHQREAEEQEQQAGNRVLNADHLVIDREHVFPPEAELLVMLADRGRAHRCTCVLAAGMNAGLVHKRERLYARRHKRAQGGATA